MTKTFQQITANLVGKPRFAVMEGRDYIVLPITILVEGVHAGSNGPTLYLSEDMDKYIPSWNHKPVVVNHPKKNGEYVSADDPAILSTSKVGLLMANRMSGKAQGAEAWLEKSRLKDVDERILKAIDDGLIVEVSTGLFSDNEDKSGVWNGKEYSEIARNYRPDHLALLPDLVGACSVKDGCGMFTASEGMTTEKAKTIQNLLTNAWDYTDDEGKKKKKKRKTKKVVNELSHGDLWQELWDAVYEETKPQQAENTTGYIHEVYDDYLIYCVGENYYRQDYKKTKDGVELKGDPEEVKKEVVYKPVSNDGGDDMKKPCECKKEVKALADGLISANKNWKEENREWLQSQDETVLKKLTAMEAAKVENVEEEEESDEVEEEPVKTQKSAKPALANTDSPAIRTRKKQTVEEYIKSAPQPIREVLARGLQAHQAERKRLIDIIATNEANEFTEDELKHFEVPMLHKLAALAVEAEEEEKTVPLDMWNFVGQAGAPTGNTANQEEHLPLPVMNFKKDK